MSKLKETICHLKQVEPYSSCQNASESTIRDLNTCADHKMFKKYLPRNFGATVWNLKPISDLILLTTCISLTGRCLKHSYLVRLLILVSFVSWFDMSGYISEKFSPIPGWKYSYGKILGAIYWCWPRAHRQNAQAKWVSGAYIHL